MSSHCRKRLSMLTTSFSRTGSTWPTAVDARCSSIRTLSSLMWRSNPSTVMMSGASCQTRWWKETQAGFLQGVLSRASFRRQPPSGQKSFTIMSLIINNNYTKQRGIGKKLILTIRAVMLEEHVDVVAGDFNGAAWRRDNSNNISIIEEAFADCALPTPPGPQPSWGPGPIPGNSADVCGFLRPPESDRFWKVRLHGAFSIPHEALGLAPDRSKDCHHEARLHLDFVDWWKGQSQGEKYNQKILLSERPAPIHYGKQKGRISDHSLSSWCRDHSRTFMGATYNEGFCARLHQVTWWRFPLFSGRRMCLIQTLLLIIHIACMTIPTRRALLSKKSSLLNGKPPKGDMWSGERLTKTQATTRPDHVCPEVWTKIGEGTLNREKQERANEKPKLDNAQKVERHLFRRCGRCGTWRNH